VAVIFHKDKVKREERSLLGDGFFAKFPGTIRYAYRFGELIMTALAMAFAVTIGALLFHFFSSDLSRSLNLSDPISAVLPSVGTLTAYTLAECLLLFAGVVIMAYLEMLQRVADSSWQSGPVVGLIPTEGQQRMAKIRAHLPGVEFVLHEFKPDPLIEARHPQSGESYYIYGWWVDRNDRIWELVERDGYLVGI